MFEMEFMKNGVFACGKYIFMKIIDAVTDRELSNFFDSASKKCEPGQVIYTVQLPEECNIFIIRDICEKYAKTYTNPKKNRQCCTLQQINQQRKVKQYSNTVGIGENSVHEKIKEIEHPERPFIKEYYSNKDVGQQIYDSLYVNKYNREIMNEEIKQANKKKVILEYIDCITNKLQSLFINNSISKKQLKLISSVKDYQGRKLIQDIANCLGTHYTIQEHGKTPEVFCGFRFEQTLKETKMTGYPYIEEILKHIVLPKRRFLQCCENRYMNLSVEVTNYFPIPLELENDLMIRIMSQCSKTFFEDPSLQCELRLLYDDEGYLGAQVVAVTDNEIGIQEKFLFLTQEEQMEIEQILNDVIYDKCKYLIDKTYR